MAVVRGLLDEHQVVGGGDPDTPPVETESPSPGGLHPGGVLVFGPQIVACNHRVKTVSVGAGAEPSWSGPYRLF